MARWARMNGLIASLHVHTRPRHLPMCGLEAALELETPLVGLWPRILTR